MTFLDAPLVTIVVPVYNVRDYLEDCFSSLVNQTYKNIEILLVDDGSTDGSGELCDELAAADCRATVLHKTNGGLSDARNYGVERCRGEWVCFVDSDDCVSPVYVEALVRAVGRTGCAMAAFPFAREFYDGDDAGLCRDMAEVEALGEVEVVSAKRYIDSLLRHLCDTGAPFRIMRREAAVARPFPAGMTFEDAAVVYRIVHDGGDVAMIPCDGLYGYRQRSGSITRSGASGAMIESAIEIGRQVEDDMRSWYPQDWASACSCGFSINRVAFMRTAPEQRAERRRLWAEMSRYRAGLLRDSGSKPVKRFAAGLAYLGMGPFAAVSTVFDRVKGNGA